MTDQTSAEPFYVLPESTPRGTLDYLASRPYNEAANLIHAIQQAATADDYMAALEADDADTREPTLELAHEYDPPA